MNNANLNINSIRQPAPNVAQATSEVQQRQFNLPKVGVVSVPKISKTPLADTLALKKQENPRTAYKLTIENNKKGLNFQNAISLLIAGCSIIALFSFKGKGK